MRASKLTQMKARLGCLAVLISLNGSGQNLGAGLTACYPLNGNGNDMINAQQGTLSAVTPTVDRFNNAASAMFFSGTTSSFLQLPNSPLLKPAGAISVSGWYKVDNTTSYMDIVFCKNVNTSNFTAYSLTTKNSVNGYVFRSYRQSSSGSDDVSSTTTVQPGTWYHVVFSINDTVMRMYVNGVLENSTPCTIQGFNYDPLRYVILGGTDEINWNPPYTGAIDNLRFYNRMLTATEVMMLYTQDPGCTAGTPPVASFSFANDLICNGTSMAFSDLSTNSPTSWSWSVTGSPGYTSSVMNPTFSFGAPGSYTVSLVSGNGAGSSNVAIHVINVILCAGLPKTSGSAATLVPNPVKDHFRIVAIRPDRTSVIIRDMTGRIVRQIQMENGDGLISASDLSPGIYLVQYNSQLLKLVKE
jgi:hypothetical protein